MERREDRAEPGRPVHPARSVRAPEPVRPSPSIVERTERALADDRLRRATRTTMEKLQAGREQAVSELDEYEQLREHARKVRTHTIQHLDYYLTQLAERVRAAGGHVHFAPTDEDVVECVLDIAVRSGVKRVAKSKSMISEEVRLNERLSEAGIRPVETDLGEYIIQLAGETPSHIITPALHKSREEIRRLFATEAGEPLSTETEELTAFARKRLRQEFAQADMGMTGCNFAVAETGAVTLVTNEGNGRMVTSVPPVLVTVMGMERIVPTLEDLDVMLELLPRSATGQKQTSYVSVLNGPRRDGEVDGPREFHLVIVDNGRSNILGDDEFEEVLNCIRCGACINVCPVYRHVGGHAYGWVYPGPIGAVLTPLIQGIGDWGEVAQASSLCGACTDVCPVKIPLHDMLIGLRRRSEGAGDGTRGERLAMRGYAAIMKSPRRLRWAVKGARVAQGPFVREEMMRGGPPPISYWTGGRDLPAIPNMTFRKRWRRELQAGAPVTSHSDRAARVRRNAGKGGGPGTSTRDV